VISARVFHGWRIVAAGFVLEMLMGALLFHAYGAYVVLLRQEFGWSKTLFSVAFAMARAESGILGPIQGWLTDRFGPRALIRIGMTIFGSAAFGTITGISSMVVMFGMVGGPIIAGVLADRTGSYELGFCILAGLAVLGSIFFVLARRPSPPPRA
jgi:MFS family permease